MTTVQPAAIPADQTLPRLVPALLGKPGQQQTVYLPCPEWCIVDHVELHELTVEDITHWSTLFGLQVASMLDPGTAHIQLFARVNSDPANEDPRMRVAHVLVGDGFAEDAYLTPAMAGQFVDNLIAFAEQVRSLADGITAVTA